MKKSRGISRLKLLGAATAAAGASLAGGARVVSAAIGPAVSANHLLQDPVVNAVKGAACMVQAETARILL